MARLRERLMDDGWNVISVNGIASLRQHNLGALQIAGFGGVSQRQNTGPLAVMTDRITETLTPRSVILVDDWDDLDETSWGVLAAAQFKSEMPMAVSRVIEHEDRVTPTGVSTSALGTPFRVEMSPLRVDEVASVLEEVLDGPVSPDLVARVFARSGGNVGLVVALAQVADREHRIVRRGGIWVLVRELYSPSLRGLLASHLSDLTMEERDCLEILALVGTVKLSLARRLVDWGMIEALERHGFVRVFGFPDAQVMVQPPLLLEFFRHEPFGMRRARLNELVLTQLGSHSDELPSLDVTAVAPITEDAVVFVTVIGDHTRRQRAVAEALWRESPTAVTGKAYLSSLLRVRASAAEIETVLKGTPRPLSCATADYADIEFVIAQANWLAFHANDLDAAISLLEEVAADTSPMARLAEAELVQLMTFFGPVPEDYARRLRVTPELPARVRLALYEVHAGICLAAGDLAGASELICRALDADPLSLGFTGKLLFSLIDLFEGRFEEGMSYAYREYMQAVEELDSDSVRAFAWVYTLGLIFQGNYKKIDSVVVSVLGIGDTPVRGIYQIGLLNNAVMGALHSGRPDLARRYIDEMDRMIAPNGFFLGQHRSWARAQMLAYEGHQQEGSDLLREASDELWERGGRLSAAMGYLIAQEIYPRGELYEQDMDRSRQIQGRFIGVQVDFVEAVAREDETGLLGLVDELVSTGLPGMALSAFAQVGEWARARGDQAVAVRMKSRTEELRSRLPEGAGDTVRFTLTKVALSNREREFIGQIATGAANKVIAEALSVSVRTVESAVSRIARKLDVEGRRGIINWVNAHP